MKIALKDGQAFEVKFIDFTNYNTVIITHYEDTADEYDIKDIDYICIS